MLPIQEVKYIVTDVETNIKNVGEKAIGSMKAAPWCEQNKIVYAGFKSNSSKVVLSERYPEAPITYILHFPEMDQASIAIPIFLIGHNIKFDLHFLRKTEPDKYYELINKVILWDTQAVEYLLSGQSHQWAKLNDLISKYKGTLKDDKMADYWAKGIDTEDIPEKELLPYLDNDVLQTELVFKHQYLQILQNPKMFNLIKSQMECLLSIQEMEYNGMTFDKDKAVQIAMKLQEDVDQYQEYLNQTIHDTTGISEPNCSSSQQISIFLFGGKWEETTKVPDYDDNGTQKVFKTGLRKGELKFKNLKIEKTFKGQIEPHPSWLGKNGYYSTSVGILKKIIADPKILDELKSFCEIALKARELEKDISTYYVGFYALTWPDDRIHGRLNNCATNTGRLSSSNPNLQNLANK